MLKWKKKYFFSYALFGWLLENLLTTQDNFVTGNSNVIYAIGKRADQNLETGLNPQFNIVLQYLNDPEKFT